MTYDEAFEKLVAFSDLYTIPRNQIVVGGSMAAAMLDIDLGREISDIDIEIVSPSIYGGLAGILPGRIVELPDCDYGRRSAYVVNYGVLDIHTWAGYPDEGIDGFRVWNVNTLMTFKMRMGRPKDKKDIEKIREYLAS